MAMYKVGKCKSCSYEGPLIAGFCHKHYWESRANKKKDKPKEKKKKELNVFFANEISNLPTKCENGCGATLVKFPSWQVRAQIAHILPKRHFTTIATNPNNKLYLCVDCHTKFDNSLSSEIVKMPLFPLLRYRYSKFKDLIPQEHVKHLPDWAFGL